MKKLALLLTVFISFSSLFGQVIDEGQLFGSTRNLHGKSTNSYDFGIVNQDVVAHEFFIYNPDVIDIEIAYVTASQGLAILIPQKTIKSKEEGKIIVYVHKNYLDLNEKKFSEDFSVTIKQHVSFDVTISKTYVYTVMGYVE